MSAPAPAFDPRTAFPDFYQNSAIQVLADAARWTISGQLSDLDEDSSVQARKAPIDIQHLIATGAVRGAWRTDETCLVTLPQLTQSIPQASNVAYYLRAKTDGLIVIDIEPSCPPAIAQNLLLLPGLRYRERSMSGRGFHLVAELPTNFDDFPVATDKRVLRHPEGWYEILLEHWITFTRNVTTARHPAMIPEHPAGAPVFDSVDEVYAYLATKARPSALGSGALIDTALEAPVIVEADSTIEAMLAGVKNRLRDPADFNHDLSRWEFSVLGRLYTELEYRLRTLSAFDLNYDANERTWLLYEAAKQVIPTRPKHHELRNGRPFLLDRAAGLVADRIARPTK